MSHNIDKLIPPIRVGCPKPKEDKKLLPNAVVSGNTPTCLMDDDKEQVLILTKQYQDLIAQTEAAKAALEARIAQFDKLALQGSNKSATNTAILAALGNVPTEQITGFATEANATANKNAIIAAIPSVSSIQSGLAKTSELPTIPTDYAKEAAATANKEAIIAAINSAQTDLSAVAQRTDVKDGDDTTIGILKDVVTDAEIYAMFQGMIDAQNNIVLAADINESGYIVAPFTIDATTGVLTFN